MSKKISALTEAEQINLINKDKVKAKPQGFGKNTNQVSTTIKVLDSTETSPSPEVAPTPSPAIDEQQLAKLIQDAIALENQKAVEREQQLKAEIQKKEEENRQLNDRLSIAEKDAKILNDLGRLNGTAIASSQPLTVLGEGSQEMRNFEKFCEQAPKRGVNVNGRIVLQTDYKVSGSYWKKNQIQIKEGIEALLRGKGFLGGPSAVTNAITLPSDIPSVAFQHLSAFVRENKLPDFIHWQFANTAAAPGVPPGLNTAVARYPYAPLPGSIGSRQLNPGADVTSTSQNLTQQNTTITIQELGLGTDVNNAPIGLSDFVRSFSIVNLESIIEDHLGVDYQAYKDLCLYSQWFGTNAIYYPTANSQMTADPTQVASGGGVITRAFLINLRAFMRSQRIRPYRDGCFGFTFNTGGFAQYISILGEYERFTDPSKGSLIANILQAKTGEDFGGQIYGYKGTYDGFHMFEQNMYGFGVPGSDPGSQTITFGSGLGSQIADSNFAFGESTIAWASALPVEIRQDEVRDFGRRDRYIWYSHEAAGSLDVAPNVDPSQELRVVQVRNIRGVA